jgi:hypothetical protein
MEKEFRLQSVARMRTESPPSATFITVLRDGKRRALPHNAIVAGDIIELHRPDTAPCRIVSIPFIIPSAFPHRRQSQVDQDFDLTSDDTAAAGRAPRHGSNDLAVGPLIYLDAGETPPASMDEVNNPNAAHNSGSATNNSGTPRHDSSNAPSVPSSPLGRQNGRPTSPPATSNGNNKNGTAANNNNNDDDDDDEDPVPRLWRVLETPMVRKLYTLLNMREPPPGLTIYDEGPSPDDWPRDDFTSVDVDVDDEDTIAERALDRRDDVHRGHGR